MRKLFCLFLILCCLPLPGLAELETSLPETLRVTETAEIQKLKNSVYINTYYPQTASETVNAEMRALMTAMTERATPELPKKAANSTEGAYLDVQPSIYRTGESWMSFLSTAIIRNDRKQTYIDYDARAYDIATGSRLTLGDVIADEAGMDLVRQAVEEQLNAYFPAENADPAAISALLSNLNSAPFTLNTAFLQLHYRADSLYPNKTTLMHVRIPYTDLREHMTAEALLQTDNSNRRLLALTYDDGPVVGRTMRVVRNLRAGGATATFFLVGDRIHYCPNEVTLVHDTGFAVASHNYYHVYGSKNRGKVIEYRDKLNGELYKWIGTPVRLMRAPGGHEQVFIDENVGLPIFHWSVISKSKDNKVTDPAAEARRLANNAKDGDIILLHDIYVGTDKMALTLPGLLADKGFLCVTIEELFAVKGMELLPNTVYWDARSNEETLDPARK